MENIPFKQIVDKFGTPLYVYHGEHIEKQYGKLKNAFENIDSRIHYAMKANENIEILKIIKNLGGGIDAVSANEVDRALGVGFKPEDIVFTPSCASVNEIVYALDKKVNVHIGAIEYFPLLGNKLKGKKVGLRINPGVSIGGNQKIATSHSDSKFGIPVIFLEKVKEYQKEFGFVVNSLHVHAGSNISNVEDLKNSIDNFFKYTTIFTDLEYLDVGSGLKIKYKEDDKEIDLKSYAAHIKSKLEEYKLDLKIKIEPGKFLVGNSGYLVTTVNIIKQGYKKTFAGLNSGFNHLIRPMYYEAYHEIVNISNPGGKLKKYDIVGQLCEEDTFAYDRMLNELRIGDIVIIKSAGAYAASMAMDYNLRAKPKEIQFKNGKLYLM
ncbi:MAG TPA: diaminopimelate decarboxylase [Bacteroidetes bacterium]|nr:diaminopimelate decarboxylase [Bacteroidota bacterium]